MLKEEHDRAAGGRGEGGSRRAGRDSEARTEAGGTCWIAEPEVKEEVEAEVLHVQPCS